MINVKLLWQGSVYESHVKVNPIEQSKSNRSIDSAVESITNFLLTNIKRPSSELLSLRKFKGLENPFIQKIIYSHKEEIAETVLLEDLSIKLKESILKHISSLETVSENFILPTNNFDISEYFSEKRPSLLLSVQSKSSIMNARKSIMFKGRIGFTADGCNELFKQKEGGYVMIGRYSKLSQVAPLSRISELGFAVDEKEWMSCTGIPYELVDLVLPVELFPASLPPYIELDLQKKNATQDQREKFTKRYTEVLVIKVLNQYAYSLEFTFQQTGKYLTEGQRKQLELGNFNAEEFWSKGLKQLIKFT